MKKEHQIIINLIGQYLEKNPELRFGQALFNLDINQFKKKKPSNTKEYVPPEMRDIYNDDDTEIIGRIEKQLNTVIKINSKNIPIDPKLKEVIKRVNLIFKNKKPLS